MMGFGNKKKEEEEKAEKAKQEQISQAMRSMSDQLAEKGKKIAELEDDLEDAKKDAAAKAEAEKALMQARAELAKMKGEAARLKADAEAKAKMAAAKVEAKPAPEATLGGAAAPAPAPASGGLAAGTTAYVRQTGGKNLRLRSGPGLDTNAFAGLPPGTSMTILDGPVHDDGYPWYRVKVIDGREGWVAGTELVTSPE